MGVLDSLVCKYADLGAELLEINSLAVDPNGKLWALDCKMGLDESARAQRKDLFAQVERALGRKERRSNGARARRDCISSNSTATWACWPTARA